MPFLQESLKTLGFQINYKVTTQLDILLSVCYSNMRSWQRDGVKLRGEWNLRQFAESNVREGVAILQASCGKELALNGMANVSESLLKHRD